MDFCTHVITGRNSEQGQRELVPNHGLAAVTLILLIAFALSSAFLLRHSNWLGGIMTAAAVAGQLHASCRKAPHPIRAPD